MIHRHRWVVVEKTVLESALMRLSTRNEGEVDVRGESDRLLADTHRVHYRCSKCGTEKVVLL